MSFNDIENSEYLSEPVDLFQFVRGGSNWRYTTADADQTLGGITYLAIPITCSDLEQSQEMSRNPITIEMDKDAEFLRQYRASPPSDVVSLTILRFHEGDSEVVTRWVGRVVNVTFQERTVKVRCEPIFTSMKRPVLRRQYQTACPHVLYGAQCALSSASWGVEATLQAVNGTALSSGTFDLEPDGYYAGGFVEWQVAGGNLEKRFIVAHVGTTITINIPFVNIPGNAEVKVYPGCDHTLATCADKFSNVLNYGGQPFFPDKNPMNGTSIF